MKYFSQKTTEHPYRTILLSLGLFGAILVFAGSALDTLSERTNEAQQKTLEDAIHRSIAHCYAINGYYPDSFEYLTEHYGITYDSETFFVDYQVWSENIMPDVTIIPR